MVIYHVYNTAYVTPDLELEKRLLDAQRELKAAEEKLAKLLK